ncbi:hypothetical protein EYF80_027884 [Liparis tanakae]|uniref:Uncharacterized protein n=1 Tax=Liparis tanakae TaxID=230148 RepID=A0A4Z2H7G3_9TELE|nr:hypothetical protein EYF80_027884 [Liparis tanakae]
MTADGRAQVQLVTLESAAAITNHCYRSSRTDNYSEHNKTVKGTLCAARPSRWGSPGGPCSEDEGPEKRKEKKIDTSPANMKYGARYQRHV